MRMGIGFFLIALGAILAFAVSDRVPGVNLQMVGYICMGVGVLALLYGLVTNAQLSHTKRTEVIDHRDDRTH